jgi:hypothetical protein
MLLVWRAQMVWEWDFSKECPEELEAVEGVTFVFHVVDKTCFGTVIYESDEVLVAFPGVDFI